MNAKIEIVPFDGVWGSFSRLIKEGNLPAVGSGAAALDLGCGAGYPLYVLYHDHGFEHLTGMDLLSESLVLQNEKRNLPVEGRTPAQEMLWHCNSIYELYRLVILPEKSELRKTALQPIEFYQHFRFSWETDVYSYLEQALDGAGYDLVILSNLLHFFPHAQASELVRRAVEWLKPGGVLLVRVYHTGSIKFRTKGWTQKGEYEFRKEEGSYYAYDKSTFLELFKGMEVLSFEGVKNGQIPGYRFLTAVVRKPDQ